MSAREEEFDDLMSASSLRATHVHALDEPIPEEARDRLRETVEELTDSVEQEESE